jgi:hypothetical protein
VYSSTSLEESTGSKESKKKKKKSGAPVNWLLVYFLFG